MWKNTLSLVVLVPEVLNLDQHHQGHDLVLLIRGKLDAVVELDVHDVLLEQTLADAQLRRADGGNRVAVTVEDRDVEIGQAWAAAARVPHVLVAELEIDGIVLAVASDAGVAATVAGDGGLDPRLGDDGIVVWVLHGH